MELANNWKDVSTIPTYISLRFTLEDSLILVTFISQNLKSVVKISLKWSNPMK